MKKLYLTWKTFVKTHIIDNDPEDEILPELYIHDRRLNTGSWLWWIVAGVMALSGFAIVAINHI